MTLDEMIEWARARAGNDAADAAALLAIADALLEYQKMLNSSRKKRGPQSDSKASRLLAYLAEPRTSERIQEWWGGKSYTSALSALVACGAVRKYQDYNVDPKGHYSRLVSSYYVATGKPYVPAADTEARRRYKRQWAASKTPE